MSNLSVGQRISDAAKKWLGTPYMNNTMVRGVGVD